MLDGDIIKKIGRDTVLAALIADGFKDVTAEAIRKWETRPIPWQYRIAVQKIAKQRRIKDVPEDFVRVRRAA